LALFFILLTLLLACSGKAQAVQGVPLQLMMDLPPVSLNPRSTIDANGQRLNALFFRGLTRIDANLKAQPDLARSWKTSSGGLKIDFEIAPDQTDHELQPITAQKIAACLNFYFKGKPTSPYIASFPNWISAEATSNERVTLQLSKPDPYILKNISLLRYFRVKGVAEPCTEPTPGAELVASNAYYMAPWVAYPESEMLLLPESVKRPDLKPIHISFVEDDNTRVLKLIRGEVDATQLSLSVAKEHWLLTHYSDRFKSIVRDGVAVGYLAFNLRDPLLQDRRIREAISLGIDRGDIVKNKLYGSGTLAGSLLSPQLQESSYHVFAYDPEKAKQLLAQAGYSIAHPLVLHYKTTPVREGYEQGLIFKDMLAKIGVNLVLDLVEPAVFTASVKKGKYQLYASRWLGVADGSILYRTLYSKNPDNRTGYSNPAVDRLLEKAVSELDEQRRIILLKEVQEIAAQDLPFFPLWFWNTNLILRKDAPFFSTLTPKSLSLSGALEPMLLERD
jgi:peptide/nickel transport system substrate-binding protein